MSGEVLREIYFKRQSRLDHFPAMADLITKMGFRTARNIWRKDRKMANGTEAALFGLTDEQLEKTSDFPPTFDLAQLGVKDTFKCKIIDEAPKMQKHKDKITGDEIETPIISVIDEFNGMTYTLWLSSVSLKMGMANIHKTMNTLKDVNVLIGVRLYDHKTYGKDTRAYTVQIDQSKTYVDKSE